MSHFGGSKYKFRPAAIVTYSAGQWGGMRAAMQLRSFLGELGCLSTSNILAFAFAQNVLNEDGTVKDQTQVGHWKTQSNRCFEQLEWVAHAVHNHRAQNPF
eukprot:TRINITY_DN5127_c0_g1_i9.p1 TRINITY_DN5127_c0_g1~~TRINITY_DN5127_c0_g1_i9.p1  ORF type:complete len:101 (-),score=7.18 TRINITY_DN5127_c0_g1_i9:269-571(-)